LKDSRNDDGIIERLKSSDLTLISLDPFTFTKGTRESLDGEWKAEGCEFNEVGLCPKGKTAFIRVSQNEPPP
jgi:hypothetical protein